MIKKKILIFEINSKKRIILVSVKSNYEMANIESLGAELYTNINVGKSKEYFIDTKSLNEHQNNLIDHFAHGLKLKSYEFKKYKSKKEKRLISINIVGKEKILNFNQQNLKH